MTKADWRHRLTTMEADLGLSDGFRFVYGPLSTLKTGRIAFLSLNPGRAPSATNLREISDERGNSYDVERHTTLSPIADQALQAFAFFGAEPNEVLTGVVCPFRTPSWGDLSRSQQTRALAIGHEFWKEPLERPDIDLIICCSNDATHAITDWLAHGLRLLFRRAGAVSKFISTERPRVSRSWRCRICRASACSADRNPRQRSGRYLSKRPSRTKS